MLIRQAELDFGARVADLRIEDGLVVELAPHLPRRAGEDVIEAKGGALLPALHDHHIHLYALAAALDSVVCGPPGITHADALAAVLRARDAALDSGAWLRGVGFHESVFAGSGVEIDRDWLDGVLPQRPARIQHRSGRLWILNSAALLRLSLAPDAAGGDPLERVNGRITGRLYDADAWLRARIGGERPDLGRVSRMLWQWGVIKITDASHGNGLADYRAFAAAQARGELLQDIFVMGNADLDGAQDTVQDCCRIRRGHHKFHLHEHALPDFDQVCADIRRARAAGRNVAFHCVARAELVFALSALCETGARAGDRIEHAGVAPPDLTREIAALGLTVVTQPGFIAERGDAYLRDVAAEDRPWLYRLRGFIDVGIRLAGSSDAPYGDPNPWRIMHAATARRTGNGAVLGAAESLTCEQAMALMQDGVRGPTGRPRPVRAGAPADFFLMAMPWAALCADLSAVCPILTLKRGRGAEALLPESFACRMSRNRMKRYQPLRSTAKVISTPVRRPRRCFGR